MADLYHLAYVSDVMLVTPDKEPAQELSDDQLQEILATAKKNNEEIDVTGALLFSGRHFAQVLEGSEAAINDRFRVISQDTRHHNVTPLLYAPAGERQFKNWSMALCLPEELDSPPAIYDSKPSPGSVEAGDLGRGLVASLAAAIDRRSNRTV
ncbi:MAG: BLUF domain-containing protein [Luminiphilus sp.]|nr:BLUF domain-containing protein [Luminiphilus sp.]